MYKYYIVYQMQGIIGSCQSSVDFKLSDIERIVKLARGIEKDLNYEEKSLVITNFILLDQPHDSEK